MINNTYAKAYTEVLEIIKYFPKEEYSKIPLKKIEFYKNNMDKDSKQVVVLLTHPNIKESRANKALMDAISDMGEVAIYNLYEMRVEDAFNAEIWSTIISHASALVFQFPFYWMSAPSLLKRWLDEVFTYLAKTPAVAGKTLMVVTTVGSEHDAYRSGGRNRFTVDELLRPYQASAVHAGMIWQTPLVVYGMGTSEASKNIAEGINCYKQRIEALVKKDIFSDNW